MVSVLGPCVCVPVVIRVNPYLILYSSDESSHHEPPTAWAVTGVSHSPASASDYLMGTHSDSCGSLWKVGVLQWLEGLLGTGSGFDRYRGQEMVNIPEAFPQL